MFLGDKNIKKSIFDYKRAFVLSKRFGIDLEGIDFDLLLATYILNTSVAHDDFKAIATFYDYDDVLYDEAVYGNLGQRFGA